MRLSTAISAICLSAAAMCADDVQAAIRRQTNIPAQGLGPALQILATERNFQLIYVSEEINDLRTPGAVGELTPEEALQRLLIGTGLTFRYLDDRTVTIEPAAARAPVAQTNDSAAKIELEEVVVTATRREQKLQDVPVAVSAITAEDIVTRGYTQYADYLNSVPGVTFTDTGPGKSSIRIRGQSTLEGGFASSVASYFGETITSVLTSQGGKPNLRLVDIDRVEILRGPQGTLFGANALAGVVRIIPANADTDAFDAQVGVRGFTTAHSRDESYHIEGMINVPLLRDRLALRLVGYQDDIAGYVDNVFTGQPEIDYSDALGAPPGTLVIPAIPPITRRDINSEDTRGARASLAWLPTERLRFDLMYTGQNSRLDSEPYVVPGIGKYLQSRGMDAYREGMFEEEIDITSLTATYDWDAMTLVSATGWLEFSRDDHADLTAFAINSTGGLPLPWNMASPSDSEQFTQEVRLHSTGQGPLQWILGAFYLKQDAAVSQLARDFSCPACLPVISGEEIVFSTAADPFYKEEQRAVFGEVSYDLSPHWTVSVGARYFEGEIISITPELDGFALGQDNPLPGTVTRRSTSELNPSLSLSFRPMEQFTMYLQGARGFRPGQVNGPLPSSCADQAAQLEIAALTEPDTLWNYELGAKSVLAGGRVNLNAAVYRARWGDVQLPASFTCGFSAIVNGGDATGEGVEIELVAQLAPAWRLNLAAAYNRNEFDSVAPETGFGKGDRLPGSAQKNASAGLQYDFALTERWAGFARADYTFLGEVLTAEKGIQPDYGMTNVRLALRREALAVELFGRNVADEYAAAFIQNPALGGNVIIIRPREIGVEVRYSFR